MKSITTNLNIYAEDSSISAYATAKDEYGNTITKAHVVHETNRSLKTTALCALCALSLSLAQLAATTENTQEQNVLLDAAIHASDNFRT